MSATFLEISFGVIVEKHEHWTAESLAALEAEDGGSYSDWVAYQLRQVMRKAGDRFIAEHPDLFRSEELT